LEDFKLESNIYTVKLFSYLKEQLGAAELSCEFSDPSITVGQLFNQLESKYPKFAEVRPFVRCAVNLSYSSSESTISPGDEIALISPVSGG